MLLLSDGQISTATHFNFGFGTILVGAAYFATGTLAAPVVGGAALIYGAGQLGSYLYNGNTLEENFIGP